MLECDLYDIFIQRLNQADIDYMITGSVASIIYGQPRMTHDIDLVIEMASSRLPQLIALFPLNDFYCPPLEVMRTEIGRENRGHFNIIHHQTGFKADIYPVCADAFLKEGLRRRRKVKRNDGFMWVAPPEYVIVKKLQYYVEGQSSKHITDIRGMLEVSGELIDRKLLSSWINQFGLNDVWKVV
jgi:hypothetical protein